MASFGICLEYFRRKKIDIAVIETGVGGRDDLTNVLNTKLSVITPLGLDHVVTLGDSIKSIARHKAGIIKPHTPVVAFKGPGFEIIAAEAKNKNAPLHWVEHYGSDPKSLMLGHFQEINAAIASKAATISNPRSTYAVERGLKIARLPGRMEILQENPRVIIDGAHNYQKLTNLLEEFANQKPTLIFGILGSKISPDIINLLNSFDAQLILTRPNVYGKEPAELASLLNVLRKDGVSIIDNPRDALNKAIEITPPDGTILITGSIYLAGNIRNIYYPHKQVLASRNSWPTKKGTRRFV